MYNILTLWFTRGNATKHLNFETVASNNSGEDGKYIMTLIYTAAPSAIDCDADDVGIGGVPALLLSRHI